ncbi:hypothetical protein P280DRAFT_464607, partial [Massarina eburnea CBS 473.64]
MATIPIEVGTTVTVSIIYKRTPDLKLDLDYYLSTHLPLAVKHWEQYGIIDITCSEISGDESEFSYSITLRWPDLDSWSRASTDSEVLQWERLWGMLCLCKWLGRRIEETI